MSAPFHDHDHSRGAVATLGAMELLQSLLNRAETLLDISNTLNSGNVPTSTF